MDERTPAEFETDRPVSESSDDRLNRASFAERVAGVLKDLPHAASLIVGIHGPWGDGKTTVLNLLRSELTKSTSLVVRDFNPWRLTDEDAMLRQFFGILADAIGESLYTKGERSREAAGKWAKQLRWVTRPFGWFSKSAESIDELLARLSEGALRGDSIAVEQLRQRIVERLLKSDRRIILLIDDIDRLDKAETRLLFRIIKACADFPNVCYVLAFDDTMVAKSLGDQYGAGDESSGRAFLEKIIQIPLKLPVAMREDLRSLCFQQVDRAIASAGIELTEQEVGAFVSGFDRGISIRLDTPRAAKRFGNALLFALPMLRDEVNTVDLLLLEAIRAFYPTIYDCIRTNHSDFSGVESAYSRRSPNDIRAVALVSTVIEAIDSDEQEAIKRLLRDLFPRLGSAFGGSSHGSDWLGHWAKAKRICSPDYCPRYFLYAVPLSDVSDSEIDRLCQYAVEEQGKSLNEAVHTHFVSGKARRVIERLRQRESEIIPNSVPMLALSIAKNAQHIPNPPALFSHSEPPAQAAILISRLIQQMPSGEQRVALAEHVMKASEPLWFGVECLRWFYVTDKSDKTDHNALTKEEVDKVRIVLVERIKQASEAGEKLFDTSVVQEKSLLFEWWRAEGREPVQNHLATMFEREPKSIAMFLEAMAPRGWGDGDVLPKAGELDGNQLKNIKLIFDLDELAARIQKHIPANYEDPQWFPNSDLPLERRLAEQFVYVWKKWKAEGEPADQTPDDRDGDADPPSEELAESGEENTES